MLPARPAAAAAVAVAAIDAPSLRCARRAAAANGRQRVRGGRKVGGSIVRPRYIACVADCASVNSSSNCVISSKQSRNASV